LRRERQRHPCGKAWHAARTAACWRPCELCVMTGTLEKLQDVQNRPVVGLTQACRRACADGHFKGGCCAALGGCPCYPASRRDTARTGLKVGHVKWLRFGLLCRCGLRVLAAWATSSKEPRAGVGESGGACVMTCLVASVRPDSIVHSSGQSLYTHTTTMTVSTRHWSLRTTCSSFCRVALSSH
jgi:hypothetical protein